MENQYSVPAQLGQEPRLILLKRSDGLWLPYGICSSVPMISSLAKSPMILIMRTSRSKGPSPSRSAGIPFNASAADICPFAVLIWRGNTF